MPIGNQLIRATVGIYNFWHYFLRQKKKNTKKIFFLGLFYFRNIPISILILMHSYFSYLTYNSLSPFYVFSVICKLSFVAHSMLFLLLRLGGIEKKPRPKKAFLVKF